MHSERSKLYAILAFLSVIGLIIIFHIFSPEKLLPLLTISQTLSLLGAKMCFIKYECKSPVDLPNPPLSEPELQIIFTVVSVHVFTKQNFNLFSNLTSPFSIGTPEIQWLFSIFLTHNWSPKMSVYLFLSRVLAYNSGQQEDF